jgi:aryl-alcohol dehydrogenase-like predicted oxidoreductase
MTYRRCGRSGLLLPAVSLGLWQNFGDDRPLETQRSVLRRAFDPGVTHFDLANNYGRVEGATVASLLLASEVILVRGVAPPESDEPNCSGAYGGELSALRR